MFFSYVCHDNEYSGNINFSRSRHLQYKTFESTFARISLFLERCGWFRFAHCSECSIKILEIKIKLGNFCVKLQVYLLQVMNSAIFLHLKLVHLRRALVRKKASRGKGKQNAKERKQQTPVSIIYPHIKKCYSYGRVRFWLRAMIYGKVKVLSLAAICSFVFVWIGVPP